MVKSINAETGFCIRVNMYIIRHIFKNAKNKLSKDTTMNDLYEVIGIDRQKFQKICGGQNYYLTQDKRKRLSACFNIEEKYFAEGGKMFIVHGLDEQKWKCFFNQHYGVYYKIDGVPNKRQQDYKKEVSQILEEECKNFEYIEKSYSTDSPIFRVAYYFKNGIAFKEERPIQRFLRELNNVEMTDWDELKSDRKRLEAYKEQLEEHIRYIQALLTISKYEVQLTNVK